MLPSVYFFMQFVLFASVHSLLASDTVKQRVQQVLPALLHRYRLAYNLCSGSLLFWVLAGWPTSPVLFVIPGWWYLLFRAAQCITLVFAVRCLVQTGLSDFLGFPRQDAQDQLITTGCYGVVRHPLYLLGLLFCILEPAPSAKWLLLTLLSAFYCLLAIRWEEKRLLERFGDSYAHYQATVPALLPLKIQGWRTNADLPS